MAFYEVRLPDDIERGAQGGPEFNTTVFQLSSGYEKRNINWSQPRLAWDVGYGIQSKADYAVVLAFFYTMEGKAHGFRFKDWTDFTIGATGSPQAIGTGNGVGTQFQVYKAYVNGSVTYQRTIKKLVNNGTLKLYKAGVLQVSGYSVNYDTGVITMTPAPGAGVVVSLIAEFDVPVRFDTDMLSVSAETYDAGSIPQIPIKEIRV